MEYQPISDGTYGEGERFSTFQVWMMALTKPNEETYSRIIRDPGAGVGRAIVWLIVTALIGTTISVVSNAIFGGFSNSSQLAELKELFPESQELIKNLPIFLAICIPASVIISLIIFFVQTGVLHFIAGALGGNGSYSDMIYAFAAFSSPYTLVYSLIAAIPIVQCFSFLLGFYALYLGILAIKVVHRFDWGKALGTYGILIIFAMVIACVIVALAMSTVTQLFEGMGA